MNNDKIIIGLVGEMGSGKDTVADYLKHRYNATLFRFSDPIKDMLHMFFDRISREDQAWMAVTLKKRFGGDILERALERKMRSAISSRILSINGLRYMEDYTFVRSFQKNSVLYVTAAQEVRWARSVRRGEKTDDSQDLQHFQGVEHDLETEQHIPEIGAQADFRIENNTNMEALFSQVDAVMEKILHN